MILLAVMVALAAMMLAAAPASADDNDDEDCFFFGGVLICEDNDDGFFGNDFFRDNDFCDSFDIDDEDCFVFDRDRDFLDVGDVSQDIEQDADSGDIDQDFSVTSTGDNSNQCVSTQGVSNTGNTQTVGSFDLLGGDFDDFDIDDSGADIDVGGTNTTDCTSEVNQAASASG